MKREEQVSKMLEQAIKFIADLSNVHTEGIATMLDEMDTPKVKVNFGVTLDAGGPRPSVKVDISYTKAVKDSRTAEAEDPDQLQFEVVIAPQPGDTEAGDESGDDPGADPAPASMECELPHGHPDNPVGQDDPPAPKRRGRKKAAAATE